MLLRPLLALALSQLSTGAGERLAAQRVVEDSARLVRSVRSAQSSFEAFRRNHLPVGYGLEGPCDIHIGRYCYVRGDEGDEPTPPAESPDIGRRRDELIRLLDSASHAIAGDAWIAGQYVRYLAEAGRTDQAFQFASQDCRASASWCAALAGYAAHVGEKFALADSAYSVALAAMDETERCRWLDLSPLLENDVERRFRDLDCAGREQLARRIFWLGAPMYQVGYTDLRTEHFARLTRARIAEKSANPYSMAWGDDQREMMLRYGWPRWYSRSLPQYGMMSSVSITGHDAGTPYNFIPSGRGIDSVSSLASDDWRLADRLARFGYAPSYAKTMHDVPSQIAVFRRRDSAVVVAAWDVRRDTTLIGRDIAAALVMADPSSPGRTAIVRVDSAKPTGRITLRAPFDSGLVSLELLARDDRRAGRMRLGVSPRGPQRIELSDLLLYAPDTAPPFELAAVRDSALASTRVPGSRPMGVFWETYGLKPNSEPVHFTLTVEQVGIGWLRRAAEQLRFADPSSALRIQWEEVPEQRGGIAGRGVRVDLSRLRPGRYRMQLSVSVVGEPDAVTTREIDVR